MLSYYWHWAFVCRALDFPPRLILHYTFGFIHSFIIWFSACGLRSVFHCEPTVLHMLELSIVASEPQPHDSLRSSRCRHLTLSNKHGLTQFPRLPLLSPAGILPAARRLIWFSVFTFAISYWGETGVEYDEWWCQTWGASVCKLRCILG